MIYTGSNHAISIPRTDCQSVQIDALHDVGSPQESHCRDNTAMQDLQENLAGDEHYAPHNHQQSNVDEMGNS